ncbi:lectin-like [Rhincodon typus]|uniref:lectin-like n=1 Tax=Rhincodon typus TaxID=259920 RepID=UPI00202EC9C0|nr:lectin-like [Rhincodon typus]
MMLLMGLVLSTLIVSDVAADIALNEELEKSEQEKMTQGSWIFGRSHVLHDEYCSHGWFYRGYCYTFIERLMPWITAEMYCQKLAPGGHLASIHSKLQNNFIRQLIHEANERDPETWIGLNNVFKWESLTWTDGSGVDFTDWYSTNPILIRRLFLRCVMFNFDIPNKWEISYCLPRKPFVCAYKLQLN